ncbi:ARM repeat-containing protein [Suillus paluster]|uniref:ARM repeat-containing protein n=1 Tax=Suillus paluster TaxID=48578 RepID=UPI001B85FEC7|nr:ARM repeat-containing protein [Suillus paluster]KAG1756841.1 ARM repeat-containing protein [Suillus paluster]
MTVRTVTVSTLKTLKNSVIGNPAAKLDLAQDTAFIHLLVNCLKHPPTSYADTRGSHDDIRIEAAHVIASISYGSEIALVSLLHANALHAFLFALSNLRPDDAVQLKPALARGLRVLSTAIAEVVGPSQLGLRTWSPDLRSEAKAALSYLFEFDCLNIFLPLLADPSSQTNIAIAQFISTTVRSEAHRNVVVEWLPPAERSKESKGRRGWEKKELVTSSSPARRGGWVVRLLVNFLQKKDIKLQEAALGAISSLAMENTVVATTLTRAWPDAVDTPLNIILNLMKSRSTDVQLAASLCAAHVLRATASHHPGSIDYSAALNVIHVVNRVLSCPSETAQNKIKTCYTLYHLVKDDQDLCREVYERGTLEKVVLLAKHITPPKKTSEWEEDEPESTLALREATLTVIAAISLFDNNIRREVADDLQLVPTIQASLSHKNVGIRHAACTCLRALSRAVSIMRTNIMDSAVGMEIFAIFMKEDEDPRVTYAALNAICNLVINCSPLKPKLLDQGLLPRLMQLFSSDDLNMRVSILWTMRNTLDKSNLGIKQTVMTHLGWPRLVTLYNDSSPEIQEQVMAILCNLADEEGVDYVFESIDTETLANCITFGLESSNEHVTRHTACFAANIANGSREQQDSVFAHAHVIHAMHDCMTDAKSDTRRPLVSCIFSLVQSNMRWKHELTEAGIISTLRHICEWTAGVSVSMSPGGRHPRIHTNDDKEAARLARGVLDLLEHSNIGDLL